MRELIIDNFAGGGGASTGIEMAMGRSPDIAINHSPEAIRMHRLNHPTTKHYCEDVWQVDPQEATRGRPVGLAWFSPDCTHFSKAKGGKPKSNKIRGLAWVVYRWAKAVKPRVIFLENVEEFEDWGPLMDNGHPDPDKKGFTFRRWWKQLENLGYKLECRQLKACDYGAPTSRKRLFIIARCDGKPIHWPEATHGNGLEPYRAAAECIDWDVPCPSIFERKRPLAEATLRRIARGVMRYVVNAKQPFLVMSIDHQGSGPGGGLAGADDPVTTITSKARHCVIAPSLINTRNGERVGQAPRVYDPQKPYPTVTAQGSQGALVAAFLARHYGGHENDGSDLRIPMHTITAQDHHALVAAHLSKFYGTTTGQEASSPLSTVTGQGNHHALVAAFLLKYYGTDQDPKIDGPLHTITAKHRFGLVTVSGEPYTIVDIGMRMLQPNELFRAQGFPTDVKLTGTKTNQVRLCGNSVSPPVAAAIVRANMFEQHQRAVA